MARVTPAGGKPGENEQALQAADKLAGYEQADERWRYQEAESAEHLRAKAERWDDCKPDPKPVARKVALCEVCGREFRASNQHPRRTCSMACYRRSSIPHEKRIRGQKRRGEANPNYRHGNRVGDQIRGWSPADKGETCCRKCGSREWLQLHHAIPRSKHRASRRDLRNGITLCASCHQRWHRGGYGLHRELFTPEEWSYLLSVELVGENTAAWLDRHYPPQEIAF